MEIFADNTHPEVRRTAALLTAGISEPREQLERLFLFVRDEILFGFPAGGDFVKASQTIELGYGQCNTKGILFLALCKAVGISARLHFSRISKEIQRGFFTGWFYFLMPDEISHSWLEVEIDGQWHRIDTYINDLKLHRAAVEEVKRRGWKTGLSVSSYDGEPSSDLVLDDQHFSQMAAVVGDQGVWNEPGEFLNSPDYLNRPGLIRHWAYRCYRPLVNWRIRQLRSQNPVK
tara:strand:- start:165698 stop:166393 length:696 start_codon:yes stop_codon:yes gene_type:complete